MKINLNFAAFVIVAVVFSAICYSLDINVVNVVRNVL